MEHAGMLRHQMAKFCGWGALAFNMLSQWQGTGEKVHPDMSRRENW